MATAVFLAAFAFAGSVIGSWLANRYAGARRDASAEGVLNTDPPRRGPILIRRQREPKKIRVNDDAAAARAEQNERG